PAELAVLLRIAQEVDDLDELRFRLLDAGDILERDPVAARLVPPRARATERSEHVLRTSTPHQPDEEHDEQDRGAEPKQERLPPRRAGVERLRTHDYALTLEERGKRVVVGERRNLGLEQRRRFRL